MKIELTARQRNALRGLVRDEIRSVKAAQARGGMDWWNAELRQAHCLQLINRSAQLRGLLAILQPKRAVKP